MRQVLSPMAGWIRRQPLARQAARAAIALIPDVEHTTRVRQLGPVRMRLRRHRWMLFEDMLANDGYVLGQFERLVRPGDVVYDVGANIGVFTRVFAQWLAASRVVAFEPMTENAALLRRNVELGGIADRVEVHEVALSDAEGEQQLQIDDVTSGTAVLDAVSGGRPSQGRLSRGLAPKTERVAVTTLDRFLETRDVPPPAVVKIDTEGAEALVLAGARRTLETRRPRLAIAMHGPPCFRACLAVLDDLGYHTWGPVHAGAGETVYRRLRADDADRLANNNIASSPDEADVREPIQRLREVPRRS